VSPSKLIYGLESVQVNDSLKHKIDAFQLKGLRQILKLQTTYVNRANSNEHVFRVANDSINTWDARRREGGEGFKPEKRIIPISEYYEQQRRKLIIAVLRSPQTDPITDICVDKSTLKLKDYETRRVGRPRFNWWIHGLHNYWAYLTRKYLPHYRTQEFSIENREHLVMIELAANNGWGQQESLTAS